MEFYPPDSPIPLRTPEEMKEAWNTTAIKGDGVRAEGFWPGLARNVHAGAENLMEGASLMNPISYLPWLAGASVEALSKPFSDYSKGEDVSAGDAGMAALEAVPGYRLAKLAYTKGLGRAAVGQALTKKARSFEDMHPRGDWYTKHGKAPHLAGMGYDAMKDIVKRSWDTEANALFRKHKISPNKREEFLRYFEQLDNPFIKKGNKLPSTQIHNEINSEAEYTNAMMEKFFPGNTAFAKDMGNHLMPKKFMTTGDNFAGSGIPMHKVLDTNMTNDALRNHVSAPMVEEFGLKGKDVVLATKPWNDSPLAMLHNLGNRPDRVMSPRGSFMYHGIGGKYNAAATASMLYKKMEGPFSMDALETAARQHNSESYDLLLAAEKASGSTNNEILRGIRQRHFRHNPLVNIDELKRSAKVSDGYISFGGRMTGQDRVFANYNTRFVVKDSSDPRHVQWAGYGRGDGPITPFDDDAHLFVYDQMEQGTGFKVVDAALTAGTKKLMGIDSFKVNREVVTGFKPAKTSTEASQASGGLSSRARSALTRAALERKMYYESTFKDRAIQAGQTATVMQGLGSLWQWKDYKYDPSQDFEGDSP